MGTIRRCRPALGTYVEVSITEMPIPGDNARNEDALLDRTNAAFAELERLEKIFSFHDEDSSLSQLNREAHQHPIVVPNELAEVLRFALELSAMTAGEFDLSVGQNLVATGALPDHRFGTSPTGNWEQISLEGNTVTFAQPLALDCGGIAKGFIVDRMAHVLGDPSHYCINAGGDLRLSPWQDEQIGVPIPSTLGGVKSIAMRAPCIATTAGYYLEGTMAVLSGTSRKAVDLDNVSVSVFAPDCVVADALTKVILTAPNAQEVLAHYSAEAIILDQHGNTTVMDGIA